MLPSPHNRLKIHLSTISSNGKEDAEAAEIIGSLFLIKKHIRLGVNLREMNCDLDLKSTI